MSEIIIGVGAVVEDDKGRILLVMHRPERGGYWKGKWICPGGKLELGETLEEGARREIKEETGLDIEIGRQIPPFERIVREDGGSTLHVIYIDFMAKVVGGKFTPQSDVGQGRWVTRSEMKGMWGELHEDTQRLMKLAGVV